MNTSKQKNSHLLLFIKKVNMTLALTIGLGITLGFIGCILVLHAIIALDKILL
jgi:hypothetical protein